MLLAVGVLVGPLVGGLAAQEETLEEKIEESPTATVLAAEDMDALAKTSQNPVGSLISLPLQNNTNFGGAQRPGVTGSTTQNTLNIQPVVPIGLSKKWNLINRVIMPVIYQPEISPGQGSTFGLGDTTYTGFISPKAPGKLIWGVGPVISIPTATDDVLGSGEWAAGPSVVLLAMPGSWVTGILLSQIWSLDSDADTEVSFFLSQIFANYNMKKGWFLTTQPIFTANWEAESGQQWTVPVGGGIGRVYKIGKQPVNTIIQGYYNVERPDLGAKWQLRLQFTFLFPRKD
jgi:hypothetical protein